MAIRLTSALSTSFRDELEALLFFNANQSTVARGIIATIDKYGLPKIIENRHSLHLKVDSPYEIQTLYALEEQSESPELIGALVYTRISIETIVLLHISVKEEYCLNGQQSQKMLAVKLFDKLKAIARQIKGVRFLQTTYGDGSKEKMELRR